MNRTDLLYRKTAVEGASGFGLLIALYDTLAGDLRRAGAAQRANDIEGRCREAKHAMTVIGYLESCLHRSEGGELTLQLKAFYRTLRRKLIEAQAKQSAEILEQQMAEVLRIREYWQKIDQRTPASEPDPMRAAAMLPGGYSPVSAERTRSSWSV
jgi:flagellar biosynthetic protein FliS